MAAGSIARSSAPGSGRRGGRRGPADPGSGGRRVARGLAHERGRERRPGWRSAIIHRPRYDDWSLPKGKLAPGESHIEGAVREVLAETGFRVQPGRTLGEVRYLKESGGGAREKVVHYWAMRAIGGGSSPNREVDRARVADGGREARRERGHARHRPGGAGAIRAAACDDRLRAARAPCQRRQPGRTGTGTTGLRPLDETGQDQADELVRLLSRFEVDDIWSTPTPCGAWRPCRPLSESIGVSARTGIHCSSEDGFPGHEEKAVGADPQPGAPRGARRSHAVRRGVIDEIVSRLAESDEMTWRTRSD